MAEHGRYFKVEETENATAEIIGNTLADLADILVVGPPEEEDEKIAVIRVAGDPEAEPGSKEARDHFELGEAGGGLDTKPIPYERGNNLPDGTGRYIEIETEENTASGSGLPFPNLKYNDPIYLGTETKKNLIDEDIPGQSYFMIADQAQTKITDGAILNIAGKAKVIIGESYPNSLNSYTSWNPSQPGRTWGETLYGPLVRLHGTSCIDIDDGVMRVSPTVNIHGGCFMDIADGSYYDYDTHTLKYKNSQSRHSWVGLNSVPWGNLNQHGPWLHMHDNASLVMDAGSAIISHDTAVAVFEGNSELIMQNTGSLVCNGGRYRQDSGDVYVGGGNPVVKFFNNVDFQAYGNSQFILANNARFIVEGSGDLHFGGSGKFDNINEGYVGITNGNGRGDDYCPTYNVTTDASKLAVDIHAAAQVHLGGFTQFLQQGYAMTNMEGKSIFQMMSKIDTGDDRSKDDPFGPLISCTPNQFEFVSQGVSLNANGRFIGRRGTDGNPGPAIVYGEYEMKTSMPEARFLVQGNSVTIFGGDKITSSYFNMAGGTVYIQNNIFSQQTGTAHTERHDASIFIMRGTPETSDGDGNPLPAWYDGHVPQASLPSSHLHKTWGRGEINENTAPDVEIYDKSRVWLRGVWNGNTNANAVHGGSVEFHTDDPNVDASNVQQNADFITAMSNLNMVIVDDTDLVCTADASREGWYTVTGFTYKLINWYPHPQKLGLSPVIEVIEEAEVRCLGNVKFILVDSDNASQDIGGNTYQEGLTIEEGNTSVHFSMADLQALYDMIHPQQPGQ